MRNKGFTLIETLVAMLLLSLSGVIIAGAIVTSTKNLREITKKSAIDVLLTEYTNIIESGLKNSEVVDYKNSKCPIVSSNKYKCYGCYESVDGQIVFKVIDINEDGDIKETKSNIILVPMKNHFFNSKKKAAASFEYEYIDDVFKCKVLLEYDGNIYEKCFDVNTINRALNR